MIIECEFSQKPSFLATIKKLKKHSCVLERRNLCTVWIIEDMDRVPKRIKGPKNRIRGRMSCFIFIKNAFLASLNWKIYSKLSKSFFHLSPLFNAQSCCYRKNHFFNLNFFFFPVIFIMIELKARILGPSDLYVKSGSEITLICKLQQGPHDLGSIYWYKGK